MIEFNINENKTIRKNVLDENGNLLLDENKNYVIEEVLVPKTNKEILKEKTDILKTEKGKCIASLSQYNFVWANQKALNLTDDELYAKYTVEIDEWYKAYNLLQEIQNQAIELGVDL